MEIASVLMFATMAIGATVIFFAFFFAMFRIPSKIDAWREHFFRNLLRFARHGVPLTVGLERLSESAGWPYGGWLSTVAYRLSQGIPLEQAVCPDERDSFGPVSMPQVMPEADARLLGRVSEGVPLEVVLGQLAAKYRARVDFRQRMRTQLLLPIYILFFLATSVSTMTGLTMFVMPAFEEIFADLGASPEVQQIASQGVSAAYMAAPVALLALLIMGAAYFNPRSVRFRNLVVHIPLIKRLVRNAEWALIGRHLEAAVACERPLQAAISDLPGSAFTSRTSTELDGLVESMSTGTPPGEALETVALPAGWHALVSVGLAGGSLSRQLGQASDYLEEILIADISRAEKAFGAGVVLAAGIVVGLVVTGVFKALVTIVELV